jgi:gamma-glutamylcyclotransferase (GGCT)/AIG2-like uncharacterized protein YtfP
MAEKLFVYGTLHPGKAPSEIAEVVSRFQPVGEGTVRGRLYKFDDYPAMILDRKGQPVSGHVFSIPENSNALKQLDAYEEYSPEDPQDSLFIRQKTRVTLHNGKQAQCWIYVYNKPIPAHQIQSQLASVA